MMMPIRIQRKRTRGWRKPPNSVCVTRGGPWGNPFVVRTDLEPGAKIGASYSAVPTVDDAIACFRLWAEADADYIARARKNLCGKDLACFCPLNDPCHADVLLELANPKATDRD